MNKDIDGIREYIARCNCLGLKPVLDGVVIEFDEVNNIFCAIGFDKDTFVNGIKDKTFIFPDLCTSYKPDKGEEHHLCKLLLDNNIDSVDFNNIIHSVYSLYYPSPQVGLRLVKADKWKELHCYDGCHFTKRLSVNGIKSINANLHNYKELQSLEARSVKELTVHDFYMWNKLEYLYLDKLETLDRNVLHTVPHLKYLYAPNLRNGLVNFAVCPDIKYVNLDSYDFEEYTRNNSMFNGCIELKIVHMKALKEVPDRLFYNCQQLSVLDIPNVEKLGKHCFRYCASLTKLYLPKVKYFDVMAVVGCVNLKEVVLDKDAEVIGELPSVTIIKGG